MQIIMIPTNKIFGHPNNPRTDNGDLAELTASIKQMGILQNLTVVPYDPATHKGVTVPNDGGDYYIAVAGNRRLAAAKKAKLTEVPAVISNMDFRTQMKVMLVENLQRETLTPFQESKTIQLMLDLGDTVEDIVKETGFSESTVRNRLKLAVFNPDKLAEVEGRNATMKDYLDLAKLEDETLRNEVLGFIGTADFRNKLAYAKSTIRDKNTRAEQEAFLATFATKITIDQANGKKFVLSIYLQDKVDGLKVPDDKDTVQYFYTFNTYNWQLWRERTAQDTSDDTQRQQRNDMLKAHTASIKEASDRARQLRMEFVKNLSFTKMKQNFDAVVKAMGAHILFYTTARYTYVELDHALLHDLTGVPLTDKGVIDRAELMDEADRRPEWTMFSLIYSFLDTGKVSYINELFVSGHPYAVGQYQKCAALDTAYDLLVALGYEMSQEEKQLVDGTHPCYYVEPKKDSKKKTA